MMKFRNIIDELKQLEASNTEQLNELFGGVAATMGKKALNYLQRTAVGKGKRDLERKADVMNKKWLEYRGQSGAIPNRPNIENWVKNSLGMKNIYVWKLAIEEFQEEYPKAAEKYIKNRRLDKYEIRNFLEKLIQIRLAYIDKELTEPTKQQPPQQLEIGQNPSKDWTGARYKGKSAPASVDLSGRDNASSENT